jgi:hypothetical protein
LWGRRRRRLRLLLLLAGGGRGGLLQARGGSGHGGGGGEARGAQLGADGVELVHVLAHLLVQLWVVRCGVCVAALVDQIPHTYI